MDSSVLSVATSANTLHDEENNNNNNKGDKLNDTKGTAAAAKKKTRHRNRKLYSDILRQMEFYFSDANLHKDKFLNERMLKPEGWIEVDIFADFKKIKSITSDKRVLIRALSKSAFLEISSDGKRVRRKTVYVPPKAEEVDERTVYLEPVPQEANHQFVAALLKAAGGRIAYVSLPRFKRSGQLKGFAFVEFDSSEPAVKACQLFAPTKCQSPVGLVEPDLVSKFPHSNKQLESLKKRSSQETEKSATAGEEKPPIDDRNEESNSSNNNDALTPPASNLNNIGEIVAGVSNNNNNNKFWVISKQRWLELKQQYLALQKQRIAALKQVVEGNKEKMGDGVVEKTVAKPAGESLKKQQQRKRKQDREQSKSTTDSASLDQDNNNNNNKPKHIKFDDDNDDNN